MEEFVLAEWELPPDCEAPLAAPVDAMVEVEWRGQKTEVKIRTVRIAKGAYRVFLQPHDEPNSNYVVVYKTSWPIKPQDWETRKTAQELSRIVKMAAKNQQFSSARFFYLREPQNAIAFFSEANFSDADGGWIDEREFVVPFKIRAATTAWSSPRLHNWLLNKWQNADSEVRFAWQWSRWNEKQRHHWLYPEARGLHELVQVMEWAMQSDVSLQNGDLWGWYLSERARIDDSSDRDHFQCSYQHLDIEEISPRLWRLRQFFVSHFLPLPPLGIVKPPLCLREFDRFHRSHICARVEVQTTQQQAEAALKLRGWLRQNNAPAELLALLPR